MRLLAVFRKSLRERLRDVWLLALEIAIAPLFVLLYYLMVGGGSTTLDVLVRDHDRGPGAVAALSALRELRYPDGRAMLIVREVADDAVGERLLRRREGDVLVVFPPGFSACLAERQAPPELELVGDLTNPFYSVAAMLSGTAIEGFVQAATGAQPLIAYRERALGASAGRSEFELYVPGLLILATALLIFATAMMAAREVEWGTLERLRLSRMTSFDFLAGLSLVQILVGIVLVGLCLLTALALGFRSEGALGLVFLLGIFTSIAVIGIGLIVAAVSRSELEAFLIGNFPLFLLMFFTGAMFPLPKLVLLHVGGYGLGPADLLPPTHAVVAINKVLTHGAGLADITGELLALTVLSVLYYAVGVWLFQRRQLRTRI